MDDEWETLPHIIFTSENTWTPSCMDYSHDDEKWFDALEDFNLGPDAKQPFDQYGSYRHTFRANTAQYLNCHPDPDSIDFAVEKVVAYTAHTREYCLFGADSASNPPPIPLEDIERVIGKEHIFYNVNELETAPPDDPGSLEVPPEPPPSPVVTHLKDPDFDKLRPLFGWCSVDKIKRTFQQTT